MRLETILVTPDLAEMFLKNNSANRKLRVTHVDMFVRELQAGTFRTTHQGVAISKSGKLLDGQHRLSAIVKAGIPATMVVAWDCDVETAIDWPVDFGLARTTSDVTGTPHHEIAVYSVALYFVYGVGRRFSTAEIQQASKALLGLYTKLVSMCPTAKRVFSRAPVRLAAMLRMADGSQYAGEQYAALIHFDYGVMSQSVAAFHKHMLNASSAKDFVAAPMAARAWCAFDPTKKDAKRQQLTDYTNQIAEMVAVMNKLGLTASTQSVGVST